MAAASLLQSCSRLDMLICNAGVMALPQLQRTAQGFEMQSGVNWLGHVHLVNLLLPRIKEQKVPRLLGRGEAELLSHLHGDENQAPR